MSENQYQPGEYQKGDKVVTAHSVNDAVALVFKGFKRKVAEVISSPGGLEDQAPESTPTQTDKAAKTAKNEESK